MASQDGNEFTYNLVQSLNDLSAYQATHKVLLELKNSRQVLENKLTGLKKNGYKSTSRELIKASEALLTYDRLERVILTSVYAKIKENVQGGDEQIAEESRKLLQFLPQLLEEKTHHQFIVKGNEAHKTQVVMAFYQLRIYSYLWQQKCSPSYLPVEILQVFLPMSEAHKSMTQGMCCRKLVTYVDIYPKMFFVCMCVEFLHSNISFILYVN
jgi:hypothetical protein